MREIKRVKEVERIWKRRREGKEKTKKR